MLASLLRARNSFVLAQAVAACYALAVGTVVLRRVNFSGERGTMEGFPVWRLAVMAILDMLHLVPMIVAAADVAPTLTVLLLQCSAPFCLAVSGVFCKRCACALEWRNDEACCFPAALSLHPPRPPLYLRLMFLYSLYVHGNLRLLFSYSLYVHSVCEHKETRICRTARRVDVGTSAE